MSTELEDVLDQEIPEGTKTGYLDYSLSRTTRQIRDDRGREIYENLEMAYKRAVEDIEWEIKRLDRKIVASFDFSPNNALSLVMVKDLDTKEIVETDFNRAIEKRNLIIKLNIMKQRYNFLFGHTYDIDKEVL